MNRGELKNIIKECILETIPDFDLKRKEDKILYVDSDMALKLIYEWVKTGSINFKQFKYLIEFNRKTTSLLETESGKNLPFVEKLIADELIKMGYTYSSENEREIVSKIPEAAAQVYADGDKRASSRMVKYWMRSGNDFISDVLSYLPRK